MAKADAQMSHVPVTVLLDLSQEEARELKAMVQNPSSDDETQAARDVRAAIFDALTKVGI